MFTPSKASLLYRYSRLSAHQRWHHARNALSHNLGIETIADIIELMHARPEDMIWEVEEREMKDQLFEDKCNAEVTTHKH